MKRLIALSILVVLAMAACKNNTSNTEISTKEKVPIVPKKDVTINNDNSYSDLFLDTSMVGRFIDTSNLGSDVSQSMRSFYNLRNFQFAWFASDGLTEQARSFWNLATYKKDSTLANKTLSSKLRILLEEDSLKVRPNDTSIIKTELMLTEYFVKFMLKDYKSATENKSDWAFIIPRRKGEIVAMADSFAAKKDGAYDDANQSYKLLKDQLSKYVAIAKKGGWPAVVADKKAYKKNTASAAVASIRKRLSFTGELSAGDTSNMFDTALVVAIKAYQNSVGISPDGNVSDALIKQLNVPVQKRIEQILINLDRMRWLPENESGNYIVANIPEFKIHVYDSGRQQFEMKTVVGKQGHSTVIFTGNLNQVVFAPYWNIPSSIVKKEILPGIRRNKNYLARHNMEIANGRYRQKPGGSNSLGHVKFLFPNDFDIYFHDTPAKSLFNRDNRAYSHGCIRLAEPAKMANYILRNDTTWNPHRIDSAMNSKKEKTVFIKKSVPVLITYYTAWVGQGQLNFRNDIYGNDSLVASKMFIKPL